jgi:hypothetical protein
VTHILAYQLRSALPAAMVGFLENQSAGELVAITWIEPDRLKFTAHFEKEGKRFEDKVFRYKLAAQQAGRAAKLKRSSAGA